MLARIVNEQGRAQIGKGWGGSRESGLQRLHRRATPVARLRGDGPSEFYASLVPTSPNVATLQTNSASRVPACYYGQGRCQ
jgi:conjugal transfer mating pair stabilization protein TraN